MADAYRSDWSALPRMPDFQNIHKLGIGGMQFM